MRNVQYDIDCGNNCVIKKTMRYTAANEAIARSEAIGGAYTVVDAEDTPMTLIIEERVTALEKAAPAPADYTAGTWYYRGDKVAFEGAAYTCIAPEGVVCVWSPAEYAAYWQRD